MGKELNKNLTVHSSFAKLTPHSPKSPSATSLNSDVKLNKFEVLKIEEGSFPYTMTLNTLTKLSE